MPQRGRRVDGRKHLVACGFDVAVEPFEVAESRLVRLLLRRERGKGLAPFGLRLRARLPPLVDLDPPRLATSLEQRHLHVHLGGARLQRGDLLPMQLHLLLPPLRLELARMCALAHRRRAGFGLGELNPHAAECAFELRHTRGGQRLALAPLREPCTGAVDRRRELAVSAREQHLLPAAELLAQPAIAARLRGLALQRAALLLDLEHDVVDAREVLLRGIELQLGGAAARLVLRDPRGLFDQLPAIGGTRTEDQANLALLDDRVRLGAETGVHQELVDVLEPADLPVDQILALTRSIQPADHFDMPVRDREKSVAIAVPVHGSMPVPVAARLGLVARVMPLRRGRRGDVREQQTHFRGPGGLAGVAAAEDHVFHPVAAQALRALLAQHPRDRIGDIALAAPVRADDGGDPLVEGKLRPIRKGLETGDLEALQAHDGASPCP